MVSERLTAGIDIGSARAKAVVMGETCIRSYHILPTGMDARTAARNALGEALKILGASMQDICRIVVTGYGRVIAPFEAKQVTEITCHAKGAHWLFPSARTVVDIGGQDSKVIKLDECGAVRDFIMNDKCAAGSGRFLEVMAQAMGVKLEELGEFSLRAEKAAKISNVCTVFAESEVISLVAHGVPREEIMAGINEAITDRVLSMIMQLVPQKDFVMTGGVAKNIGVVKALERKTGSKYHIAEEPMIVGALGAALIAREL